MKTLNLKQGSDQWLQARAKSFTASVACVMMGDSGKQTRDELIKVLATGKPQEFSRYVEEVVFEKGHETEALARPIIEAEFFAGKKIYPVTVTDDTGMLLASLDGANLTYTRLWEHKQWNEKLADSVRKEKVPVEYVWQMEQAMLITGAKEVVFTVSDGTSDKLVSTIYTPVRGRAKKLTMGWAQFKLDLDEYVMNMASRGLDTAEAVEPEATPIKGLPALSVKVVGEVRESNMAVFCEQADTFIANVNRDLVTDQDFVDANNTIKFCAETTKNLKVVKEQALSGASTLYDLLQQLDLYIGKFDKARLDLEKLEKAEKDRRKEEMIATGAGQILVALVAASAEIAPYTIDDITVDFRGAIKGKRSGASMENAINTMAANGKIQIKETLDHYKESIRMVRENAPDHQFLFSDLQQLLPNDHGHLELLIKTRVSDHIQAELEKQANRKEQEQEATQGPVSPLQPPMDDYHHHADSPEQVIEQAGAGRETTVVDREKLVSAFQHISNAVMGPLVEGKMRVKGGFNAHPDLEFIEREVRAALEDMFHLNQGGE